MGVQLTKEGFDLGIVTHNGDEMLAFRAQGSSDVDVYLYDSRGKLIAYDIKSRE